MTGVWKKLLTNFSKVNKLLLLLELLSDITVCNNNKSITPITVQTNSLAINLDFRHTVAHLKSLHNVTSLIIPFELWPDFSVDKRAYIDVMLETLISFIKYRAHTYQTALYDLWLYKLVCTIIGVAESFNFAYCADGNWILVFGSWRRG